MYPHITNWVLDHLLRLPLDDRTLMSLFRSIPPPRDNPHISKLLLLKKLESNISSNSISQNTLDLLEQLAALEFQSTNTVSDTITQTYLEAAVDCTVKHLKAESDNFVGDELDAFRMLNFCGAVNVIWGEKVKIMKKFIDQGGLGSEAMWAWGDFMESYMWGNVSSILKKSESFNGVKAINSFIREEREKMGPSFLEKLAKRLETDTALQRILGLDGVACDKGLNEGKIKVQETHMSENDKGAKFIDPNEMTNEPSSAKVDKTQETIRGEEAKNSQHPQDNDAEAPPAPNKENANLMQDKSTRESMDGVTKLTKTRRRWSVKEEDDLRRQVAAYGTNWQVILNLNPGMFQGRTGVNLKDKWRNMRRHNS